MEKEYGIYLNCKTLKDGKNIFFDYTSDEINEVNYFLEDLSYITESKSKNITECKKQSKNIDNDKELMLLRLVIKKKDQKNNLIFYPSIKFNLKPPYDINLFTKKKDNSLLVWEKCLWYVINSKDSEISKNKYTEKKNDEYYLKENDILKIGSYKYIVSKIYIKDKILSKREKIINSEPYCEGISKCEFCGKAIIKLCNCPQYYHIDEIKGKIKDNCEIRNKKNVKNYYFKLLYCEENNKDIETSSKYYSLKYKCKAKDLENIELENINIEENDGDIILNFFDFDIPKNKDYMILESIEEKKDDSNDDSNEDSKIARKSVHIIELNDNEIKIGRRDYNDIILLYDNSVSKEHAIIKYDKETGNINIKNLGKYGTLAFIFPDKKDNNDNYTFHFTEKPIYFQINKTFFEACTMTKNDYIKNKKNEYSEYQIPKTINEK